MSTEALLLKLLLVCYILKDGLNVIYYFKKGIIVV